MIIIDDPRLKKVAETYVMDIIKDDVVCADNFLDFPYEKSRILSTRRFNDADDIDSGNGVGSFIDAASKYLDDNHLPGPDKLTIWDVGFRVKDHEIMDTIKVDPNSCAIFNLYYTNKYDLLNSFGVFITKCLSFTPLVSVSGWTSTGKSVSSIIAPAFDREGALVFSVSQ